MGLSFVPSVTACCLLLFQRILKIGVLSCPDRWKVASSVSASSFSSFERKSHRTSLLIVVTCCYSKIYFWILNLGRVRRIFALLIVGILIAKHIVFLVIVCCEEKTPSFIPLNINDWSFSGHCSFPTPATPTSMWTFFGYSLHNCVLNFFYNLTTNFDPWCQITHLAFWTSEAIFPQMWC
jgi:hypothetical protein